MWWDESEKLALKSAAISLILYLAVAGAYTIVVDGGGKTLASAFGVLVGIRTFFAAIECIGGTLMWRLYLKKIVVQRFVCSLRKYNFPPRYYKHDDFLNYLTRIESDGSCSDRVKWEARIMESMLAMQENGRMFQGARCHAASEIALEAYSPR
jgi:hypothetical protein